MSEDRFILVNGISEERKFFVLLKTATYFLNRQEWHVASEQSVYADWQRINEIMWHRLTKIKYQDNQPS